MPEIIDPVFAKTSQNARFLLSEYERFGLVFTKTRVYKFGQGSVDGWGTGNKMNIIVIINHKFMTHRTGGKFAPQHCLTSTYIDIYN